MKNDMFFTSMSLCIFSKRLSLSSWVPKVLYQLADKRNTYVSFTIFVMLFVCVYLASPPDFLGSL